MHMSSALSQDKVYLFEQAPVGKAIAALALPTVVSQLISTVYNLADTFFVGQLGDPDQVAAIALAMPLQLSVTALANLFGIGGSTLFSRALGARDTQRAKAISAFSFYGSLGLMLVYALLIALFQGPFLRLLGSTPELDPYTGAYLRWVLILGGLPSAFNMTIAHFIRAEGDSRAASFGLSMGGLLNILLDPIFIFPLGMGVAGAAMATFLSTCATSLYFIGYLVRHRTGTVIALAPRFFAPNREIFSGVVRTGLPSALQMLMSTLSNMVLNNVLGSFDKTAIAGIGICKKIDSVPSYILLGMTQGTVPLLAYNHSAGNKERLHKCLRTTILATVAIALFITVTLQILPEQACRLFIRDPQTVEYAAMFVRIHVASMPFAAVGFLMVGYFQAVGRSRQATILSVIRKGIFDLPMMFALNALLPLYGPVMCQAIMDFVTMLIALAMYRVSKQEG